MKAVLVFPPNWSACVAGPHLAMPLLAGVACEVDWDVEIWDLSAEYYSASSQVPATDSVINASQLGEFARLDELYFKWEDNLRLLHGSTNGGYQFGLLSGYLFPRFEESPLREVAANVRQGTLYTHFYSEQILPRFLEAKPDVVAITISSENQVIPAIELAQLVRKYLPETFLILGGNVVTRLREREALKVLLSLVDQLVLFQGETHFARTLRAIQELGVEKARQNLESPVFSETIPYSSWARPHRT